MSVTTRIKRLVRPLIPDRLMARYRLHQHSQLARSNVEVFVTSRRQARAWLHATPDTYRVHLGPLPTDPGTAEFVVLADAAASRDDERLARALASVQGVDVGVVAETSRPVLQGRRRSEPAMAPRAIAVRPEALHEVGGPLEGDRRLYGLLHRLRDAGYVVALHPEVGSGVAAGRDDPIEGECWVILSAVPMHDIGGGSRSAQLALELLRRGVHVTYVALYAAQETGDVGVRFVHPRLEQAHVSAFAPDGLLLRASRPGTVLVEAPAAPLVAQATALQRRGWTLVYDIIDDWSDPALGGDWYRPAVEEELMAAADVVVASAEALVERAARHDREAALVPNAVDDTVFGAVAAACPDDLATFDRPRIGYHGSLYGEWFDWEALSAVAEAHAAAAVVVIGDDKGHPPMPPNVHFLGLRPQSELPPYLQHLDVGIIPFVVSPATHAVSPLKVYEYLASGVPVAATPLRPLAGLEGVHLAPDLVDAVDEALAAARPDREAALVAHSWQSRLDDVFHVLGRTPPPRTENGAGRVVRPPTHHFKRERLVPTPPPAR